MRKVILSIILIFAALFASTARAQTGNTPPMRCEPVTPKDIRIGYVQNIGAWAYWWCPDGQFVWRGVRLEAITQQSIMDAQAYVYGLKPEYIRQPVPLSANAPEMAELYSAVLGAAAADPGRPAPPSPTRYVSTGSGSVYASAGNKLSRLILGKKVAPGTACTCSDFPITVGTTTYCPAAGLALGEVTVCKVAP